MSRFYAIKAHVFGCQTGIMSANYLYSHIKDGCMMNTLKTAALIGLTSLFAGCGSNVATANGHEIPEGTTSFSVTSANAPTSYTINGIENPKITMKRTYTYTFNVRTLGHPFYIMTVPNVNPANQYSNGVAGNGVEVGPLTITVPSTAPDTLYYTSSLDGGMAGTIHIEN
jgi:hypothetical protein